MALTEKAGIAHDGCPEEELVVRARIGDRNAFESLVAGYERRVFGFFMNRFRDAEQASDLVQETFIRVFIGLRDLRNPGKFSGWLFTICRNLSACRYRSMRCEPCGLEAPESVPDITPEDWSGYSGLLRTGMKSLEKDLAEPAELRYYGGLSYREIARTLGIGESLVKGRLFRARRELKRTLEGLRYSLDLTESRYDRLKEKIMKKTDFVRRAAFVFERLSLRDQIDMVRGSQEDERFGERLLAEIGFIRQGTGFLTRYRAHISFTEMINVLRYADRYIEARLVETLQEDDPELAERIKRNLFVFEDLVLFDTKALEKLFTRVPRDLMLTALAGLEAGILTHVLSPFTEQETERRMKDIVRATPVFNDVQEARREIIEIIRKMETEGELVLRRMDEVPDGEIFITC